VLQLAFVVSPVAFLITALTSNALVAALAFAAVGFSVTVCNVVSVAVRQLLVEDALLGRVNAAFRLVSLGLAPLGAAAGGALGGWLGLRAPFLAGAALLLVGLLLALHATSNRIVAAHLGEPRGSSQASDPVERASRDLP
jgi:MFS family permease